MLKRILSVVLITGILLSCCLTNVYAYNFPSAFWKMNEAYIKAVDNNDNNNIIKYGNQIIDLMKKEPLEDPVKSVLADRSQRVANVYASMGMYDKSVEMFKFFLPYGEKMDWKDSVIIANAKIPQYTTKVELYTDNGTSPYYKAKNEPRNGILFGLNAGSEVRDEIADTETAILLYHELGYPMVGTMTERMQVAQEKGLTVEFALNCPGEGSDIANFESKKYDIENVSNFLKQYPNVPVILRFGAEFNDWRNVADPGQFKEAFKYVSDYFERNNPNVAMSWSPCAVSSWGWDMNDYYPGDAYVDWVGISLYFKKYFHANPNAPEYEQTYFKTGIYSDPVLSVQEVLTKYGDRKPIMISESGSASYISSSYVTEDTTDWALQKMKEMYYYLPMVYPQIKFIAHFDVVIEEEDFDYSLANRPRMRSQYLDLVKSARLIKNGNSNATMCYQPMYNNIAVDSILPLSCYAHIFNEQIESVSYYVDGAFKEKATKIPYTSYIDLSGVSAGAHTVKAVVRTKSGKTAEKEYKIKVGKQQPISVTIDGSKLNFDQQPVIHNGRTMVPMRAIFEALGATVDWDGNSQTAAGTKDGATVRLTIGRDALSKNWRTIAYLDVPAMLVGGRTMVPVRAISESFNCKVDWDDSTKTVIITR